MKQWRVYGLAVLSVFSLWWAWHAAQDYQSLRAQQPVLAALSRPDASLDISDARNNLDALRLHAEQSPFCPADMHSGLALLYGYGMDQDLLDDEPLINWSKQAETALLNRLKCAPLDGKTWLDLAIIRVYQQGFVPSAQATYQAAASVTPHEAWLAAKRSAFARTFFPLFDEVSLEVARRDLAVLKRSRGYREKNFLSQTGIVSLSQLESAFAMMQQRKKAAGNLRTRQPQR